LLRPKGGTVTIHPVLAAAIAAAEGGELKVIGPGSSVQLSVRFV
jgi:hypothetical protein